MNDLLQNKKLVALVVGLILAGLSAVVGYSVKDQVCGVPSAAAPAVMAAPAAPAPAAPPAPAK